MTESEVFAYEIVEDSIKIWSCFSYAHEIMLPESLEGLPVRELAAYACSAHMDEGQLQALAEQGRLCLGTREGRIYGESKKEQAVRIPPRVCGLGVEAVALPFGMKKIGNYAFYNCDRMKKLVFFSGIRDLGAGLFTGCHHIRELDVTIVPDSSSCLREVLVELSEALRVNYRESGGYTRLLFPEFYEEGVENTPARILMTQVHGSGLFFRNCFRETQFQFAWYDERFDLARFQEDAEFVLELALSRLQYPWKLAEAARSRYEEYVRQHLREAGSCFLRQSMEVQGEAGSCFLGQSMEEPGGFGTGRGLAWLLESEAFKPWVTQELLAELIQEARDGEKWDMISYLMDVKGRYFRPQRRRFEL